MKFIPLEDPLVALDMISAEHHLLSETIKKRKDYDPEEHQHILNALLEKNPTRDIARRIISDFERNYGSTTEILERAIRVMELEDIQRNTKQLIAEQMNKALK